MIREGRAFWTHTFERMLTGTLQRGDISKMVEDAQALNFNMFLYCVKAPGILYYPSRIGPSHDFCTRKFDALAELIAQAHKAGIEVHSYFPLFLDGGFDPIAGQRVPGGMLARHPEWAMVSYGGPYVDWVCAAHEGYRDYLSELIREQLANYDLDGIHLDFVRYRPSPCFCSKCVENVKRRFGMDISSRPHVEFSLAPKELDLESLIDYYCGNVHDAVVQLCAVARSVRRGVKLSAAVFPSPRMATAVLYQDWIGFASYLDFICPMSYYYSVERYRKAIPQMRKLLPRSTYLYPGIMTNNAPPPRKGNENYVQEPASLSYVAEAIKAVREAGADGFCVFCYEAAFGIGPNPYTKEEASAAQGSIDELKVAAALDERAIPPHSLPLSSSL